MPTTKSPSEEAALTTYSGSVRAAIADPEGARVVLLSLGELLGWPPGELAPIPHNRGEESWRLAIGNASPLWLGLAWEGVERRERVARQAREQDEELAEDRRQAESQQATTNGKRGQSAHRDEGECIRMPVLQPSEAGSFLEPGTYRAQVSSIEETTSEYNGKPTAQLQFQFVILDADGQQTDQEIRGWCSAKWHEKAKLFAWARVLLGRRCPATTEPFDSDRLLGRKLDLEVIAYVKKDGKPGTKISQVYPFASMAKQVDDEGDAEQKSA